MPTPMPDAMVAEMWDRYEAGEPAQAISRRLDRHRGVIGARIRRAGGIRPTIPRRGARHLQPEEREEISRGLAVGQSLRAIARQLGRAPSTVSREVAVNGGATAYRAAKADQAAVVRRRRPKVCKLVASPRLQTLVAARLAQRVVA